ncbi:putative DNA binding domain-containing protein [Akkermansiaceae bacterium]|nr:putative DNA binding domain-containing protein [Akkermansiaceae bacterium]
MLPVSLQSASDLETLRESCELECKLAAGQDGKGELPRDFWKSYSAMANTNGGVVLLGVKEKGGVFTFHSIVNPDKILKDLFDTVNNPGKVSVNLLSNESAQTLVIEGHTIIAVGIPRASRRQRPVFLDGNPLGGHCYRRLHEGDQRMSDEDVKLMLAEQQHDSLDDELLPTYTMADLDYGTLKVYRQTHTNLNPGHVWSGLDDLDFLRAIGGWKRDRESEQEGLTKAGLLMFGSHRSIREVFPNFFLDYMERPESKSDKRWIDRVTFDGTWAGNLYSFYLKVYPKLTADLKVPFQVVDGLRQEDSPVHVALREALANVLVHADYRDRAKIYVVKRPDMFGFLNPGLMRIPIETAVEGYESDCRNRTLHEMFRYVNIGEQAGTGLQKILAGWATRHWRKPLIREEMEPNNRTILELHMLDLFDPGILDVLRISYGPAFVELEKNAQLALAITLSEGRLTHTRLAELSNLHPSDVSKVLRLLVEKGFLSLTGSGRGAVYRFTQVAATNPDDVFGSGSSTTSAPSSTISAPSSTISAPRSTINEGEESQNRDEMGRLISDKFHLPFVDSIDALTPEFLADLESVAELPRTKGRMQRKEFEDLIVRVCEGHFITIGSLARILNRGERTLRQDYLSKLCKEQRLRRAFPDTPNHEKQAYTKA